VPIPSIPADLLDSDDIARQLWEYWVSLMKTDGVIEGDEMPDWDEMEDETLLCFKEAVDHTVSGPLRKFSADLDFETSLDEAFEEARPTPPQYQAVQAQAVPCYICGRNPVPRNGKVCGNCRHSHLSTPTRGSRYG
jgi:hypothetical protein